MTEKLNYNIKHATLVDRNDPGNFSPESNYDCWWLGTCCDKCYYEEKNEERDECVAGSITLSWYSIAILIEICFDDHHS